jgi:hypothetical protein
MLFGSSSNNQSGDLGSHDTKHSSDVFDGEKVRNFSHISGILTKHIVDFMKILEIL